MYRKLAKVMNASSKLSAVLWCYLLTSNALAADVSTAAELESAMKAGGDVVLQADIQLSTPVFAEAQPVLLDLNGHSIVGDAGAYLFASSGLAVSDGTATSRAAGFNGKLVNVNVFVEGCAASFRKVVCSDSMIVLNEGGATGCAVLEVADCVLAASRNPSCIEAYGNTKTTVDNEKTGELNACVLTSEKDSCYYAQGDNNRLTVHSGEFRAAAPISVDGLPKSSLVVINSGDFGTTSGGKFGPYALIDAAGEINVVAYGGTYSELLKNPDWLVNSYLVPGPGGKYIVRANGILMDTYAEAGRFEDPEEAQMSLSEGKSSSKFSGIVYNDKEVIDGVEVKKIEGTVSIVASKPKTSKSKKGTVTTAKTSVSVKIGKKSVSLKLNALGTVNPETGEYELTELAAGDKKGNKVVLTCVQGRYTGTFTVGPKVLAKDQLEERVYKLDAVRLMPKKSDLLKRLEGAYVSLVPVKEMNGYCVLSIKIASSGTAKISAVTPTGTKLTSSCSLYDAGTYGEKTDDLVAIPVFAFKNADTSVAGMAWLDAEGNLFSQPSAGWPMVFACAEAPHDVVSASDIFGGPIQTVPEGNYYFDFELDEDDWGHPVYVDKKRGDCPVVREVLPKGLELSQTYTAAETVLGYKIVKLFKMAEKATTPKKVKGVRVYNGPTDSKLSIKNDPKTGVLTGSYMVWYESADRLYSKSDTVKLCGLIVSAKSYNDYLMSLGIEDRFVDCPMGVLNGVAKDLPNGKKAVKAIPARIVKFEE